MCFTKRHFIGWPRQNHQQVCSFDQDRVGLELILRLYCLKPDCADIHRRSQGKGSCGHAPQVLAYLVILCFEWRYPKQTTVANLKSNILFPKIFCPPTKFLGWLRHFRHLHLQYRSLPRYVGVDCYQARKNNNFWERESLTLINNWLYEPMTVFVQTFDNCRPKFGEVTRAFITPGYTPDTH